MQTSLYKIWLIARSEFWRRVRSKAFILATLLVPVGFVAVAVAPALLGYLAEQGSHQTVAVVDRTDRLEDSLSAASTDQLTFRPVDQSVDSVRAAVRAGTYDGYLLLPDSLLEGTAGATYVAAQGGGLTDKYQIEQRVSQVVQAQRLQGANVSEDVLSIIESDVSVKRRTLRDDGAQADRTLAYTAIGYAMGFIIYIAVLIYGQYVMQGVIEEKSSRVVEIIVSSVRPFELLMGKVLGIGSMGLVQMLIWGTFVAGGAAAAAPLLALFLDPSSLEVSPDASPDAIAEAAGVTIPTIPVELVVWFVLFFLGGFLLYASLFAAVGSAVERQQDAQSLLIPVMMPLIIPILFLAFVLESPNATAAVVLSLIPFFSPILMMLRAAITTVPVWELAVSFGLLVMAFVATIWIAGRIYRVGILSYGKTPSLREIARWATYH
ncbi:MAG: ABC transporter permease [Salinibacter sp.]|uniref:ABC transporter permease n=1 Tax=Salinibacter sp. TaxID=2065818 RepID=UPI0035D43809